MSIVNTTYNFNQGNMNFGEAILYGAFGSLTGGMGMMGMGGSIFNMGGFGMGGYGCCGYGGYGMSGWGYSNSIAGAQVGMAGANILSGIICRAVQGGFGGKGGVENNADDIVKDDNYYKEQAEKSIGSKLDKDITSAESNAKTIKEAGKAIIASYGKIDELKKKMDYAITTDFDKEIGLATSTRDTLSNEIKALENNNSDGSKKAEIEKKKNELQELERKIDKLTADKERAKQIKDLNDTINKNKETLKPLAPDLSITEVIKQDEFDTVADKLVETAKAAKEEAIKNEADKLKKADEEKADKAKKHADLMNDINDADGTSASRTRKSKLEARFNNDNSKIDGEINDDDVQCALAAYRKASTKGDTKEAAKWQKRLEAMLKNIGDNSNGVINKTLYNLMKKAIDD